MNNNSYEKYIQGIIGYQNIPNNNISTKYNDYSNLNNTSNTKNLSGLSQNIFENNYGYEQSVNTTQNQILEENYLDQFYPEIYRLIYPMVLSVCSNCLDNNISKETIDQLNDKVYFAIEDELDNLSTNLENRNNENNLNGTNMQNTNHKLQQKNISYSNNRSDSISNNRSGNNLNNTYQNKVENRNNQIGRKPVKNRGLYDLIRVLLIKELYNRPRPPYNRPIYGRPPFNKR